MHPMNIRTMLMRRIMRTVSHNAIISQLSSREDPLELVPESNDWINELWEIENGKRQF